MIDTAYKLSLNSSINSTIKIKYKNTKYETQPLEEIVDETTEDLFIAKPKKDNKCNSIHALLIMILSAILFSMMGVLIVYGSRMGYGSGEMLMCRGIIQTIMTTLIITYNKEWNKIIPKTAITSSIIWLILRGMFGASAGVLYFYAITLIDLGDAITAFSIYPITTTFFAYFILSEPINCSHFVSLLLAIIGVVLLSQPSFIFNNSKKDENLKAYICCIVAALFAGGSFIAMRKSRNTLLNVLVLSYSLFCIIEGYLSTFFVESFVINENILKWDHFACLIGLGIIGYLANISMTYAAQRIEAGLSSFVRSSDTIYSYIWGLILFNQTPSLLTIIGALMIVISIIIVSILKHHKEKKQKVSISNKEIIHRRKSYAVTM